MVLAERIVDGVTREPVHLQRVVVRLGQYYERAVLGVVPVAGAILLQVEPQLGSPLCTPPTDDSSSQTRRSAGSAVPCSRLQYSHSSKRPTSLQSDSQSAYSHISCAHAVPYFVFLSVANLLEVVLIIMIYYARWQHKLKTYIRETTAGNDYKKANTHIHVQSHTKR